MRSYGPGSRLHMHHDLVDSHVVSCIVHVADQSNQPWPLDFIDHDAEHHRVIFKPGTMLFMKASAPMGAPLHSMETSIATCIFTGALKPGTPRLTSS